MILIISTCKHKLHEEEFVKPITSILTENFEIVNYKDDIKLDKYDKIIICGTALKDDDYLIFLENFEILKESNKPILGICSGLQILATIYGARLSKTTEIGMINITTIKKNSIFEGDFDVYALHHNVVEICDDFDILAKSSKCIQAIKHISKPHYGILFHPEVRNEEIIKKFLMLE